MPNKIKSLLITLGIPLVALSFLIFTISKLIPSSLKENSKPQSSWSSKAPFLHSISGTGIVIPKDGITSLASRADGVIEKILIEQDGTSVKKNDPIMLLDQKSAHAQLQIALAAQEEAKVALEMAKADLKFYDNIKEVKAISREELSSRRFAVKKAMAAWKSAKAEVDAKKVDLEYLVIRAPQDGIILRIDPNVGEFIEKAKTGVYFGDLSQTWIEVEFDEINAHEINPNQKVVAIVRGYESPPLELEFVCLKPLLMDKTSLSGDSTEKVDTRSLIVRYRIKEPPKFLYVGQQIDVYAEVK